MPADPALSARPPNAIPIWTDGLTLYTELPGPVGPVILRYPLTSAGLSSALALVRTRAFDSLERQPQPSDLRPAGTLAQQMAARDLLHKLKVL